MFQIKQILPVIDIRYFVFVDIKSIAYVNSIGRNGISYNNNIFFRSAGKTKNVAETYKNISFNHIVIFHL